MMQTLNFDKPTVVLVPTTFEAEILSRQMRCMVVDRNSSVKRVSSYMVNAMLGHRKPVIICKLGNFTATLKRLEEAGIDLSIYRIYYDEKDLSKRTWDARRKIMEGVAKCDDLVPINENDAFYIYCKEAVLRAFNLSGGEVFTASEKKALEGQIKAFFGTSTKPRMQDYVNVIKTSRYVDKTIETVYRVK